MALRTQLTNLMPRVLSALVAIGILWVALRWQPHGIFTLTLVAVGLCAYEFIGLAMSRSGLRATKLAFVAAAILTYLAFTLRPDTAILSALLVWASLMASLLIQVRSPEDLSQVVQRQGWISLGLIYCGVIPSLAPRLTGWDERGPLWLITLLALVFVGDTCAYFVGLTMGKHKIFPALSPKKTIEGAVGGVAGSLSVGLALWFAFFRDFSLFSFLLLCLLTALFAQTGDFFESLLKRAANVKDSGQIMPGHGGILDRLDGVLFALPIYYATAHALRILN